MITEIVHSTKISGGQRFHLSRVPAKNSLTGLIYHNDKNLGLVGTIENENIYILNKYKFDVWVKVDWSCGTIDIHGPSFVESPRLDVSYEEMAIVTPKTQMSDKTIDILVTIFKDMIWVLNLESPDRVGNFLHIHEFKPSRQTEDKYFKYKVVLLGDDLVNETFCNMYQIAKCKCII